MSIDFSTISHGTGTLAFVLLSVYILHRYLRRNMDRALLVAAVFSSLWLAALCLQSLGYTIDFYVRYSLELVRNAAWFGVLYALLGIGFMPNRALGARRFYATTGILLLFSALFLLTLYKGLTESLPRSEERRVGKEGRSRW